MTVQEVKEFLGKQKTFTVDFIKKDGTLRTMNARLGVKKHLKGGELPYNPTEKQLIPVFDMQKQAYRMINVSTIVEIRANGQVIKVENND